MALPRSQNMAYQVIARKWRPQTFDGVVGQQAIGTGQARLGAAQLADIAGAGIDAPPERRDIGLMRAHVLAVDGDDVATGLAPKADIPTV